jgi:hypothetical protein
MIDALKGLNPWVDNAGFDHNGNARVTATQNAFDRELVRLRTIERRPSASLDGLPALGHTASTSNSITSRHRRRRDQSRPRTVRPSDRPTVRDGLLLLCGNQQLRRECRLPCAAVVRRDDPAS